MLFISRYVGESLYSVADTDDGSEDFRTRQEIIRLKNKYDLNILGVEVSKTRVSASVMDTSYVIHPYQDSSTLTPLQVKMKMLHNIDVVMFGDMVTNIVWSANHVQSPVKLRLSDFGKQCGDRVLTRNRLVSEPKVILILDDKFEFTDLSFRVVFYQNRSNLRAGGVAVSFDVSELTNRELLACFYNCIVGEFGREFAGSVIIDKPERKNFWM